METFFRRLWISVPRVPITCLCRKQSNICCVASNAHESLDKFNKPQSKLKTKIEVPTGREGGGRAASAHVCRFSLRKCQRIFISGSKNVLNTSTIARDANDPWRGGKFSSISICFQLPPRLRSEESRRCRGKTLCFPFSLAFPLTWKLIQHFRHRRSSFSVTEKYFPRRLCDSNTA